MVNVLSETKFPRELDHSQPYIQTYRPDDGSPPSHKFSVTGLSSVATATLASLLWMGFSSGLIMLNKHLLSNGFPYPMALSGMGMAFSGLASYLACHQFALVTPKHMVTKKFFFTKLFPIGLCMALTLNFGNLVYLHLTVSFIQILKSFTPVITMVALFISRLETPTLKVITSVCIIAAGTALASIGEVQFSFLGVLIMFASESFEALRLVMTQLLLTGLKFHPVEGLMYLAPSCFFWLALGSVWLELPSMMQNNALAVVASQPLFFGSAAVLGFAVNFLAYVIIQTASSLTLKVLGTAKNAFVVWCGIFFLGDTVTVMQGLGYAISLGAFYWYQRLKVQQMRAEEGIPPQNRNPCQADDHGLLVEKADRGVQITTNEVKGSVV